MSFRFEPLEIRDIVLVAPEVHPDARGGLSEAFRAAPFRAAGIETGFVQENHLRSHRGVIRGLNYQLEPHSQGRLVQVLQGSVLDVAVDLREGSPTCGEHVTRTLTAEIPELLWIPSGFAHGVAFLEDNTLVAYKATRSEYTPAAKRSIRWDDPALAIDWPFEHPILSEIDREAPLFDDAEKNFEFASAHRHPRHGRIAGRVTRSPEPHAREKLPPGKFLQ